MHFTQVKHITELRLDLFIINNDSTLLHTRMTGRQSFCWPSEITHTVISLEQRHVESEDAEKS